MGSFYIDLQILDDAIKNPPIYKRGGVVRMRMFL